MATPPAASPGAAWSVMPGSQDLAPAQPFGRDDQSGAEQRGQHAARGGTEQPLVHRVAHQEDPGEHQRGGAEPDAPAGREQRLDVGTRGDGGIRLGRGRRCFDRLGGDRRRLRFGLLDHLRRWDERDRRWQRLGGGHRRVLAGGQRFDAAAKCGDLGARRQRLEEADDAQEPAGDQDQYEQDCELFHG